MPLAILIFGIAGCLPDSVAKGLGTPQTCIDNNNELNGIWIEPTGGSNQFPSLISFHKTGNTVGLFEGLGAPHTYSLTEECDAIMIIDANDTLVITYDYSFSNSWLRLVNWGRLHYYYRQDQEPQWPATISVRYIVPISIEDWLAWGWPMKKNWTALRMGGGALVGMEVHPNTRPDGRSWNGLRIQERVWHVAGSDSCGLASGINKPENYFCTCDGLPCDAIFTVGQQDSIVPPGIADAEENVLWDLHVAPGGISALHHTGKDNCTYECEQEYDVVGAAITISHHLIRYTFTRDEPNEFTRVSIWKE